MKFVKQLNMKSRTTYENKPKYHYEYSRHKKI